jgi:dGTPase
LQEVQRLSIEKLSPRRPVLEIEAAGFDVLGGLPDAFTAIFDASQGHRSQSCSCSPEQFAPLARNGSLTHEKILLTDFVAGMIAER